MQRENFYLVLELDESVLDWPTIESRILEMKRTWSREATGGSPKAQRRAQKYLPLIPEIEAVLSEDESRRKEAKEARKRRQKERQERLRELDEQIDMLRHGDGTYDNKLLEKLERSFRGSIVRAEIVKRLRAAGVRPAGEATSEQKRPERPSIDKVTGKNLRKNLDHLGLASLYEFLDLAPSSSPRALGDRAQEVLDKLHRLGRTDADSSARNELAGQCKKLFSDLDSKSRYDAYLAVEAMDGLKGSLEVAGSDRFITQQEMAGLIKQAGKRGVAPDDARAFIESYARERKWGVQAIDDKVLDELQFCGYCSAVAAQGARLCGDCGEPLEMECPSCGTANPTRNSACESCGFQVGDAPLVSSLVKRGERLRIDGDFAGALRALDKALLYWPDHAPAKAARERIDHERSAFEADLQQINEFLGKRHFNAARRALESFERRHGGKGPEPARRQIERGLTEAQTAFERGEALRRNGKPEEALDAYEEALATCGDFQPAQDALAASPPPAPFDLRIEGLPDGFRLHWREAPTERAITYRVLRKDRGAPQDASDGREIAHVAGCQLDDVDIPVGEVCYYAIASVRNGVPSATVTTSGPHLRISEVDALRAVAGNREVTLSWQRPPGCTRVAIWRRIGKAPEVGGGQAVTIAGSGARDTGLENGSVYGYRVVAYFADPIQPGAELASPGAPIQATPVAPPPAVMDLRADRRGQVVTLHWTPISEAGIHIRHTTTEPTCTPNQILSIEELEHIGDAIPNASSGSARLTLRDQGRTFFVPFSVTAGTAVAGNPIEVTQLDPITDLTSRRVSGGIFLTWTWPSGLQDALVTYAHDRYPTDPTSDHHTKIQVSRPEYDRDGGFHLRRAQQKPHYFCVFSCSGKLYAAPARLLEGMGQTLTISYRVILKKSLFRRAIEDAWLELTAPDAQDDFSMPELVVVGKPGRVPLSPRDGQTVASANGLRFEAGRSRLEIPPEHWESSLFLKLFFRDAENAREIRLIPAKQDLLQVG